MKTSSEERIAALTSSGLWGTLTLHDMLAEHALSRPGALAVKDQPNRIELTGDSAQALSWSELEQASDNLAVQLAAQSVTADSVLLVQLPNIVELLVVYYAASKLGAIVSPVPDRLVALVIEIAAGTLPGGRIHAQFGGALGGAHGE